MRYHLSVTLKTYTRVNFYE